MINQLFSLFNLVFYKMQILILGTKYTKALVLAMISSNDTLYFTSLPTYIEALVLATIIDTLTFTSLPMYTAALVLAHIGRNMPDTLELLERAC
jgi:hypothetical protein